MQPFKQLRKINDLSWYGSFVSFHCRGQCSRHISGERRGVRVGGRVCVGGVTVAANFARSTAIALQNQDQ